MTDYEKLMSDSDYLLAESCLAIYDILTEATDSEDSDSAPHQQNQNNNQQQNTNNTVNKPTQNNNDSAPHGNVNQQNNNQHQNSSNNQTHTITNNSNNKPNENQPNQNNGNNSAPVTITKDDLMNPQALDKIMKKAKRQNDIKTVKTVLRSAISLGSLAAAVVAPGVSKVPVMAASILSNMAMNLHSQKQDREMQQMGILIDKKIGELSAEIIMEKDPDKKKFKEEYMNSLKQAKLKIKAVRNA